MYQLNTVKASKAGEFSSKANKALLAIANLVLGATSPMIEVSRTTLEQAIRELTMIDNPIAKSLALEFASVR